MNSNAPDPGAARRSPFGDFDVAIVQRYWLAAAVVALAAVIRSFSWITCDTSWLLTVGEHVLSGARPYIDFTDPNPPASFLIYLPAIWIGRLTGAPPESILTILTFAGVFLSVSAVGRILSEGEIVSRDEFPSLLPLAFVVLLILPGNVFAEREHIALLAMLPMLSVYAVRACGMPIGVVAAILAGIGGGVAISIKPYLGLALAVPLPYVSWCWLRQRQELRKLIFSSEHLATALIVLVYGASVLWLFPAYVRDILPLVLTLYVPVRDPLLVMFRNPSVVLVGMAGLVGFGLEGFKVRFARVAILAVVGLTIALMMQGKGWPYQGYPAVALSLLMLSVPVTRRISAFLASRMPIKSTSIDVTFGALLFAGTYALASFWFLLEPDRAQLVSEVSRVAPAQPRIVTFTGGPEVAFPLTRVLHGTLLGRAPFQWISHSAKKLLDAGVSSPIARLQLEAYERADSIELADTIRTGRPDVILIGSQSEETWALSFPALAAAMQPYGKIATVDGVEIWLPRKSAKSVAP